MKRTRLEQALTDLEAERLVLDRAIAKLRLYVPKRVDKPAEKNALAMHERMAKLKEFTDEDLAKEAKALAAQGRTASARESR